jgi:DNA repair protein RadC
MRELFKNYFGHEVKIRLVREAGPVKKYRIKTPRDVYDLVKTELADVDREVFLAVYLSTENAVMGVNTVSVGSLNASLAHPREVFKPAILLNASSIILLHNHPSGGLAPSRDDLETTDGLARAGKLLGIEVVDHLIVGSGAFYSFLENNLLKKG